MTDKAQLEKEHSEQMNKEALERIKAEAEKYIFEDDEKIKLRNGKTYVVPPLTLRNARLLMKKLRTVNVDAIILNFLPTGNDEADLKREDDLFDILKMAFVNYPEVDRDFIDVHMDLDTARITIEVLIGLNGLKK